MQRNQWKTASEQLLAHWRRSGITHVPSGKLEANPSAAEWLERNENRIFEENDGTANSDNSTAIVGAALVPTQSLSPSLPIEQAARPLAPVSNVVPGSSNLVQGRWNTSPMDFVARQAAFQVLSEQVIACRKCEDIVCRRQRTVFGAGPTTARIVMFGEAPGADEDRLGEPFVGAAGQLLDKILIASGLKRDEVYIMNSLKCRPPNNRTPVESEIDNCRPFFETQLETIQPEYIVCWGSIAVRAVLKSTESVGRLRGKFHSYRGAKVMVTYHPAYLLRNPDAKKLTWEDMKMLMREIGIKVPGSA